MRYTFCIPLQLRDSLTNRGKEASWRCTITNPRFEVEVYEQKVEGTLRQGMIEVVNFCGIGTLKVDTGCSQKDAEIVTSLGEQQTKHLLELERSKRAAAESNENEPASEEAEPTIQERYYEWIESLEKRELSKKVVDEHRRNMAGMLYLFGDCSPKGFTARNADEVLRVACLMPLGNIKPYNQMIKPGMSVKDKEQVYEKRVEMALNEEVPEEHLVGSIKHTLKTGQGFFSWLHKNYYVDHKPFADRRIKLAPPKLRGAFTKIEMSRIVSDASKQQDPAKKWVPLITAYTGMRNSEVETLEKNQLRQCEDSGIYYFQVGITSSEIGKAKTAAGIRRVPIANQLLDRGIIEFINERSEDDARLFPVPHKWLTRQYSQRIKPECDLPDCDSDGKFLTMYSSRHSVTSYIRGQGVNNAISSAIVGHESGKSVHDGYTKVALFPLDKLKECVDGLPW